MRSSLTLPTTLPCISSPLLVPSSSGFPRFPRLCLSHRANVNVLLLFVHVSLSLSLSLSRSLSLSLSLALRFSIDLSTDVRDARAGGP